MEKLPAKAQNILDFWFKETPPKKRFQKHKDFDLLIKDKFLKDYELASKNEYDYWQDSVLGCLALVILFDQFSRNIFRDNKRAFEHDHKTRLIVNDAVYAGFLDKMDENQRFFMILPLIHSEEITDHDMAYYLLDKYLKDLSGLADIKKFWKDHTLAIKRFHRYPHRNEVLGRVSTSEEIEFLKGPNSSW